MEAPNLVQALEELALGVERLRQVNSVNVASTTIMAFDWLLTFNMEFALIWNTKWNWTKILYLITRYMPFVDTSLVTYHQFRTTLPQPACKRIFDTTAFMFVTGMAIAELVFTLRTCAVWGKAKKLTWIVLSAYVATWSTIFIVLGFYVKNLTQRLRNSSSDAGTRSAFRVGMSSSIAHTTTGFPGCSDNDFLEGTLVSHLYKSFCRDGSVEYRDYGDKGARIREPGGALGDVLFVDFVINSVYPFSLGASSSNLNMLVVT
ncbi:hypothetical protein P691DRAFT_775627 [Macrolepiota fuliginosa MF-IS2]|uniref:DUF6533 domain-containing protein n=1 Tax=Macrolepiota fuliginosa MF-IS2 TaxID=1400762 RepID=A0A9P5XCG1_9AGAR|nr:hypothetical protein P691DRAFT_775627 [Macrolepiota fuliginosa MF-IS2]